eukprot:CAMPEP_0206228938 /NCGR_PEP_ID=MMETSP0047_2-20121206/9430_1 /ASSEMBLY_ACC=CAM_ASM_000192 /TAXON_ID=195065 /ORGANISM="Chroomonas mesostigmatica_cf, Strain CCMP1168" /LENGTH=229 /DNA_ID=CAMNT_0053652203 /DNA_START=51 /DNA_END=740 /DNA_ORIENTATION=-
MAATSAPDYGAIPTGGEPRPVGQRTVHRAKLSVMAKVAPFLVLAMMMALTLLSSSLEKDEKLYDQDLYAIEEDDMYNKRLVWTGSEWVDEASGKSVRLASRQRTQQLLMTQALAAKPAAAGGKQNYECCLISKLGAHNSAVVKQSHSIETGFYCHMSLQGLPSSQWPMVRMGSLREAEVSTEEGQAGALLGSKAVHACTDSERFLKARTVSLAGELPARLFARVVRNSY